MRKKGLLMKTFLKENLVLVMGALLPIIIVILFGVAILIPRFLVASPKYNLLFSVGQYYDGGYQFNIVGGKLQIQYSCTRGCANKIPMQKLFLLDAQSRVVKPIPLTSPLIPTATQNFTSQINVPQLANVKINPAMEAPDGYRFNVGGNMGNFLDIFSSNNTPSIALSKNSNTVIIPIGNNIYNYYEIHFIGWIVGEDK